MSCDRVSESWAGTTSRVLIAGLDEDEEGRVGCVVVNVEYNFYICIGFCCGCVFK